MNRHSSPVTRHSDADLPPDVVLSVRHVSKKFCRNLRRSMLYGMQDLARNMLGLRPGKGTGFIGDAGMVSLGIGDGGHSAKGRQPPSRSPTKPISDETDFSDSPNAANETNLRLPPLRRDEFWALQDVNFELRRGEILGLIGSNGCGKSTLLRLIAGIFPPDTGMVTIRGRVGALIALGAGFHPHMTGRENVYLNGVILGMTRLEVDERFNDIAAFADIGDFIDAPVSTYSSGMTVRLGFAIAIHTRPEVLLVDEVIAVGDAQFRAKCFRALATLLKRGVSVVFVSHQKEDIQRICSTCLWLVSGKVQKLGNTEAVASEYNAWIDAAQLSSASLAKLESDKPKVAGACITRVTCLTHAGEVATDFKTRDELRIRLEYSREHTVEQFNVSISFTTAAEALYNGYATAFDGVVVRPEQATGYVDLIFPSLCLGAGTYWVNVSIADRDYVGLYDWRWQIVRLTIRNDGRMLGRFNLPHRWEGAGVRAEGLPARLVPHASA